MIRVLLVGGALDGTSVDAPDTGPAADGYSEQNVYGLPDPTHAWSAADTSAVPVALAEGSGLMTVAALIATGGPPIMPETTRSAVFAAFARWVAAQ